MVKCDLCRLGEASYACRRCGARVCAKCLDEYSWLCHNCVLATHRPLVVGTSPPSTLPALMRTIGALLIAAGVLLFVLIPFVVGGEVAGGGIVFIGPIPIAFATGETWPLILVGVTFVMATLITLLAAFRALA